MNPGDMKNTVRPFATVIMAAGKGKRMLNPELPKVLYQVDGRPMIDYVVALALRIDSLKTIVVVRHQRDSVVEHVSSQFGPRVTFVEQREQFGTGHAVLQTESELEGFQGDVLVLSGDVPLLREKTLMGMIEEHRTSRAVATILTADIPNPSGYGRILRQEDGSVRRIVEDRDASESERAVKEINSGIYVFEKVELFKALRNLRSHNVQNEYYLTDVFERFWNEKLKVLAVKVHDCNEVRGVNTVDELRQAQEAYLKGSTGIGKSLERGLS